MKSGRTKDKRTKEKNFWYNFAFSVTVFFEGLLYIIVIGSALAMIGLLVCALCFYGYQHIGSGNQYMTLFGVFATVSFVPILGLVATMISAYRNSLSEIEGDLAKCTGMEVQFKLLPFSASSDTILELQQAVNEEKNILSNLKAYEEEDLDKIISEDMLDYDYQVVLDFKQDLAELYKITLCDLKIIGDKKQAEQQYIIRNKECIMSSVSIVKDLSGIKRNENAGEHACVFVRNSLNGERSINGLKKFIDDIDFYSRTLICSLNFQKREFLGGKRLFPISHMLLDRILKHSLRRKMVVVELDFDSLKPKVPSGSSIAFPYTIFELNITNISFGITHNLKWSKYLAQKLEIIGGGVNNVVSQ